MDWGLWVVMYAVLVCRWYVVVTRIWVWCQVIRGGEVVMRTCEMVVEVDVGVGGVVWCRRRPSALTPGRTVSARCCCVSIVAVNSFAAPVRVNSSLSISLRS